MPKACRLTGPSLHAEARSLYAEDFGTGSQPSIKVIRREMTQLHAAMASGGGGKACSRFIVEKQELGGESGS